jgi:hypothetical protein
LVNPGDGIVARLVVQRLQHGAEREQNLRSIWPLKGNENMSSIMMKTRIATNIARKVLADVGVTDIEASGIILSLGRPTSAPERAWQHPTKTHEGGTSTPYYTLRRCV